VSRIVQTEYGYHIIQLIEKKGDRINCRHILMRPRISATDKVNAIERLDSIRQKILTDSLQFEQAVILFSQDKNTVMNSGLMINPNTGGSRFEYQDLAPEIAKQIYGLQEGEVSQPFVMMDQQKNKEVCAIVRLRKKTDVHRANLVDDFQAIKGMLEQKMGQEFIHDWIIKKQKSTYIQIDPDWQNCEWEFPNWIH
jgi:peptidyl-prolyl cis-trans isomerase SurA